MLELSHLWSFRLVILIYFQMDDVTDFLRIFGDIQKLCLEKLFLLRLEVRDTKFTYRGK